MIGANYWSTGITLKWDGRKWNVSLKFQDSGWCDVRSTEGVFRCRYRVTTEELPGAIDTLIADAKRFGIVFGVTDAVKPTLYVPGDGEYKKEAYHPHWRRILAEQCARIGWRDIYTESQEVSA